MKSIQLVQGSPEWLAHRRAHFNASDLAVAMGISKKRTRSRMIQLLATGSEEEFSDYVREVVLESGHKAEAAARPQIEDEIGEDLFPVICVSDDDPRLSVSFDGLKGDETLAFECKVWNEELVKQVRAGELNEADFPDAIYQMEQGLFISKKTKEYIFTVCRADGSEMVSMRYRSRPERRAKIIPTWDQLEKDLAAHVPQEAKADVVAAPVANLPAIVYEIERGTMALSSNLPAFRAATEALIERTKSPLVTDQDFADREALCKKMREAEIMLKAKADEVVGQIADVATFSRELKDLAEMFRTTALASEKLVAAEKTNRRSAIQQGGEKMLAAHIAGLQARFAGRVQMPAYRADFAGAIKGKRTLESIQNAVDTVLAQGKIETNAMADLIDANLRSLDILASDHLFLFNDLQQIVTKQNGDFCLLAKARVEEHKVKEAAKAEAAAEAAREKIRREEQAKAEAEARARADAERREREQAEAARRAAERQEAEAAARADAARREAERAEVTPPAAVEVAPQAPPATVVPTIIDDQVREIEQTHIAPKPSRDMPATQQIVNAVALHFGVEPNVAARWLHSLNQAELARVAA